MGQEQDYQWRKPVVMLVNNGTRSGKEIAYGLKQYKIGTVIRTKLWSGCRRSSIPVKRWQPPVSCCC